MLPAHRRLVVIVDAAKVTVNGKRQHVPPLPINGIHLKEKSHQSEVRPADVRVSIAPEIPFSNVSPPPSPTGLQKSLDDFSSRIAARLKGKRTTSSAKPKPGGRSADVEEQAQALIAASPLTHADQWEPDFSIPDAVSKSGLSLRHNEARNEALGPSDLIMLPADNHSPVTVPSSTPPLSSSGAEIGGATVPSPRADHAKLAGPPRATKSRKKKGKKVVQDTQCALVSSSASAESLQVAATVSPRVPTADAAWHGAPPVFDVGDFVVKAFSAAGSVDQTQLPQQQHRQREEEERQALAQARQLRVEEQRARQEQDRERRKREEEERRKREEEEERVRQQQEQVQLTREKQERLKRQQEQERLDREAVEREKQKQEEEDARVRQLREEEERRVRLLHQEREHREEENRALIQHEREVQESRRLEEERERRRREEEGKAMPLPYDEQAVAHQRVAMELAAADEAGLRFAIASAKKPRADLEVILGSRGVVDPITSQLPPPDTLAPSGAVAVDQPASRAPVALEAETEVTSSASQSAAAVASLSSENTPSAIVVERRRDESDPDGASFAFANADRPRALLPVIYGSHGTAAPPPAAGSSTLVERFPHAGGSVSSADMPDPLHEAAEVSAHLGAHASSGSAEVAVVSKSQRPSCARSKSGADLFGPDASPQSPTVRISSVLLLLFL